MEELSALRVRVTDVQFEGVQRTRQDLLESLMKDCFAATSFGELTSALAAVSQRLERLELFKDTKFVIDAAPPAAGEDAVVVRVQGRERRYRIHLGTEIQRSEVGLGAGGTFYNLLGRAERLDLNASVGSQSATPFSLSLVKPLGGNPDRLVRLSALSSLQHYVDGTAFKNRLQGISLSYGWPYNGLRTLHELRYSLDWRHVHGIGEGASLTVRRAAGHTLKSSLTHMATFSTLDNLVFPNKGVFLRTVTELAGLGGSVRFLKNELLARVHTPLLYYGTLGEAKGGMRATSRFPLITLYSAVRLGHVMGLDRLSGGSMSAPVSIIDKFQLGGPLSVRGFALNSLGPKDRKDAIGGDLSLEGALGLAFPLSQSTQEIVRGHLFVNAGILTNVDQGLSLRENLIRLGNLRPNMSLGAGLQVRMGDARLELNIAHPLSMQRGAIFHRGIQVGLGLEFL